MESVCINDGLVLRNTIPVLHLPTQAPEDIYRGLGYNYPKFFKMDLLCKWAWLGAETVLKNGSDFAWEGVDRSKIAIVLATRSGCIAVDKKYKESMQSIASPALFVYTLPNIMLGEICIRHNVKGEQLCMVQETFNADEISFWVNDLFNNRGMEHCLTGWVDATEQKHDICLFRLSKSDGPVSAVAMSEIYNTA